MLNDKFALHTSIIIKQNLKRLFTFNYLMRGGNFNGMPTYFTKGQTACAILVTILILHALI